MSDTFVAVQRTITFRLPISLSDEEAEPILQDLCLNLHARLEELAEVFRNRSEGVTAGLVVELS